MAGTLLRISGTGFMPGARVSVGGIDSVNVATMSAYFITATAPVHDAGTVDVVVTNPGGERAALQGGFSYPAASPVGNVTASLTVTPATVPAGGQLRVAWNAEGGRSSLDWIGIFRVGDSNFDYLDYQYTNGAPSGTQPWLAPSQPGQYQFRYLLDDGYTDVARSEPITVGATAAGVGAPTMTRRTVRGGARRTR